MPVPPGDRSDEELVEVFVSDAHGRGDRESAFQELVRRYRHRLYAVCIRVLGSPQDAEEAVQETFVRLARHAETFRGDARLSTWLYRVARNVCTDHVRYDARRPATPVADVTEVGDHADTDDAIGEHDTMAAVGGALRQLDDQSRLLLLLIAVDGLSYAEASEATGVAIGTIKSRVSRARLRLGEILLAADGERRPVAGTDDRPTTRARASDHEPRGPPVS